MLIHCTMEELLAIRSGEGSQGALRHLDDCQECRDELDRLHQRVAAFKTLVAPRAPRDRWPSVRRELVAGRRRRFQRVFALGSSAVAALLVVGFGVSKFLPGVMAGDAGPETDYVALVEASESLEQFLRRLQPDSRVLSGGQATAVVNLEDRLMFLDARLAEAREARMPMTDLIYLMERRIELMDALVRVHADRRTVVGF